MISECARRIISQQRGSFFRGGVTSATVMAPCFFARDAAECEEIKAITPLWHRRVWEYRLFSDPETKEYIRALEIKLISYKDVKIIRGEK